MKFSLGKAGKWLLSGGEYERRISLLFVGAISLTFILFDIIWCATTFTAFSSFELWCWTLFAGLVLVLPYIYTRSLAVMLVLMLAIDCWLVSNLLYFRTYNTVIPFYSYTLAGNLSDFKDSVYDSVRWYDSMFFVLTGLTFWYASVLKRKGRRNGDAVKPGMAARSRFLILPAVLLAAGTSVIMYQGGYKKAYSSLFQANKFSCGVPMYTVFGSLYYDVLKGKTEYSPVIGEEIQRWLTVHNEGRSYADYQGRKNVILIVAESLESWVVGLTYEGKEITPNLNRLVGDTGNFYAPFVQSQVKGGRSIDGQLLINTGLLPIENGSYSTQFPGTEYPSLVKAMKEKYASVNASLLTVDKHIVWNQGVVAKAFGYDRILDRSAFVAEEKVGPRKKTGDVPFFRQCAEKITGGEIWDRDDSNLVQIITYSGHAPFKLPRELAYISFETDMPAMMRDYMTMANYTDHAIGEFISRIDAAGFLENTTIMITGDHEGLAINRDALVRSQAGRGVVFPGQFTPLIVVNPPEGGYYRELMGQVDIYPTLLDLFGLGGYWWKGLGTSVLDPGKVPLAITPQMEVIGDAENIPSDKVARMKQA